MSRAVATALSLLVLARRRPAGRGCGRRRAGAMRRSPERSCRARWSSAGATRTGGRCVLRARGLRLVTELGQPRQGASAAVLSTRGRSVNAVIAELRADPAVAYAEPNYLFSLPESDVEGGVAGVVPRRRIAGVPVSDPQTGGQYSLDRMRVRDAWHRSTGGSNLIAVLDTGVQAGHPDLRGRVVKGYDFVNNDTGASDDNGHGTWVAGIIAANANDRLRDRRHQLERPDPAGEDHGRERHGKHRRPRRGHHLGGESGRRRHQHERRRLPVLAGHPGRGERCLEQGRRARRSRRQQQPLGDLLPGQLRPRRQRQRHPGRRRVQQLVELRAEGRRQRARVVGPHHELHGERLSAPGLGVAHLHQRHELRDPERVRRRRPDQGQVPELHAFAGRQPPAEHGR